MKNKDKQEIVKRYKERLSVFGQSIEALASGTEERRDTRFNILSSIGDLQGQRVLDLGCGLADFYNWLQKNNIETIYTGYDISPDLIRVCRERFPSCHFEVRDIQEEGITDQFDYIICSQAFNNRFSDSDNLETIQEVMSICFNACSEGFAIDMLTSYVDYKEEHLYYYSPEQLFSYAKTLTKRVALRHDYPAYEFALLLHKDFCGWKKNDN